MKLALLLVLAWPLVVPVVWAGEETAPAGSWRALPELPRKDGVVTGMGVDAGGTLWVMTNTAPEDLSWPTRKLFWWDGAKWQEPTNAAEVKGDFFYDLFGGGKRGLYAVLWSQGRGAKKDDSATVCKLVEGKVEPVVEYTQADWLDQRTTYDGVFPSAGLYVAHNGRLFAYGVDFLEMRVEDGWKVLARPKLAQSISFVEQGDLVHIVYDTFLCTVSLDGTAVTRKLRGLTGDELGCAEHAILWGDDSLLILTPPRPEPVNLHAYEIETGKTIDLGDVNAALKGKVVVDAVHAPDGSAWILPVDAIFLGRLVVSVDNAGSLRVLTQDGDVFELDELSAVSWWMKRSRSYPTSTLTASDGTFWLAPSNGGVLACKGGVFRRYRFVDVDNDAAKNEVSGVRPSDTFSFLAEGKDGTIYAASPKAVYAFHRAGASE